MAKTTSVMTFDITLTYINEKEHCQEHMRLTFMC